MSFEQQERILFDLLFDQNLRNKFCADQASTLKQYDLDDHELGGLERREAHDDVHDAAVDVVLRRCLVVDFDEVGLAGRRSLKCTLQEERLHERANVKSNLSPQRLVVWFEDNELRPPKQAFFDH